MKLTDLRPAQQQALLDLVVLAMYVDGHLASAEGARVQRLLSALGAGTEYDRNRLFDAAVSRVRRHTETAAALRQHAVTLAQSFATPEERTQAAQALGGLFASDQEVSPAEKEFLTQVQQALGV